MWTGGLLPRRGILRGYIWSKWFVQQEQQKRLNCNITQIREKGKRIKAKGEIGTEIVRIGLAPSLSRTKTIDQGEQRILEPNFQSLLQFSISTISFQRDFGQIPPWLIYWREESIGRPSSFKVSNYDRSTNTGPCHPHMFPDLQTISSIYRTHDTDIYTSSQFNFVTDLTSRQWFQKRHHSMRHETIQTLQFITENWFCEQRSFPQYPSTDLSIIPTNLDKQTFNLLVSLISSHPNQNPKATTPQASTQSVQQLKQSRPRTPDLWLWISTAPYSKLCNLRQSRHYWFILPILQQVFRAISL